MFILCFRTFSSLFEHFFIKSNLKSSSNKPTPKNKAVLNHILVPDSFINTLLYIEFYFWSNSVRLSHTFTVWRMSCKNAFCELLPKAYTNKPIGNNTTISHPNLGVLAGWYNSKSRNIGKSAVLFITSCTWEFSK